MSRLDDQRLIENSIEFKRKKLELYQQKISLAKDLPHLYGWKNYPWMREFLESTNRDCFITAANQIGKSSVQIRKIIDWATNVDLWPALWRTKPRQFWYLYPSKEVSTIEFYSKWIPDFMPKGQFKDHPVYGWKDEKKARGEIHAAHFNSGVSVYFKTYAQDVQHLQSSTVHYIATDEELPEHLYDELNFRRNAVDGYFSMVFTATLGQELWRRTMEPKDGEKPQFPGAWKKQVSLFDCKTFEDGSLSHWTDEKILRTIATCKNDNEILRRVYGRFIMSEGLKFPSFQRANNVVAPHKIPANWYWYCGVDLGAGGDKNHPSTISFIAVRPDFQYGAVVKHWRGDDRIYTQDDVANQYLVMRDEIRMHGCFYDYHARDFRTITDRMGLNFQPAEKGQQIGEEILNGLFKNRMLAIFDIPENEPIIQEFATLLSDTDKRHAKDDSADSVRYGVTRIIWDWESVGVKIQHEIAEPKRLTPHEQVDMDRKNAAIKKDDDDHSKLSLDEEIESWGELYEC